MIKIKKKLCTGYLFMLPSAIGIVIFNIFPLYDTFRRSFFDNAGEISVGVENYKQIIANDLFSLAVGNTVKLFLLVILPTITLSFLIGYLIWDFKKHNGIILATCFLPVLVPHAALTHIMRIMVESFNISWLNSERIFWVVAIFHFWKNGGLYILLFYFGIKSVETQQVEAARSMGANTIQIILSVILPNMRFILFLTGCYAMISIFSVYREVYILVGEYAHDAVYFLPQFFNNMFSRLEYGHMTAGGMLTATSIFLATLILYGWLGKEIE